MELWDLQSSAHCIPFFYYFGSPGHGFGSDLISPLMDSQISHIFTPRIEGKGRSTLPLKKWVFHPAMAF